MCAETGNLHKIQLYIQPRQNQDRMHMAYKVKIITLKKCPAAVEFNTKISAQ
jgi:hypothetical protein